MERRLELLERVGGVRARLVDGAELGELVAPLAGWEGVALVDEDGGAIRARAAVAALSEALRDRLVFEEVISLELTGHGTVLLRAGGLSAEHERVLLCAGRGSAALARGVGLVLPVALSAHLRLSFPVRGRPPQRLACLLDGSGAFGESGVYADAYPGNGTYAVGLGLTPAQEDGGVLDPLALSEAAERLQAYVQRALPGLKQRPSEVRHCWLTQLPWGIDALAVYEHRSLLAVAGNNLFKHAPALGRALAAAALGEELAADLRPHARLGADPLSLSGV